MTNNGAEIESSIQALLTNLARARAALQPELDAVDAEILALQTRRAELRAEIEQREQMTRAEIEKWVRETGDLNPHPAVQVRRVQKWVYDKDAVLAAAQERGAHQLVRVKHELNVPEFERQLKQGFIRWADAEQVNTIVIAIDTRLGDLLIGEENDDA